MAGPGSGKTTVLVERFFRLVEDHQFEPASDPGDHLYGKGRGQHEGEDSQSSSGTTRQTV